jgi:hypothetical protein
MVTFGYKYKHLLLERMRICFVNVWWSTLDRFSSHLKNSRLSTPSLLSVYDLFSINFCSGFVSKSYSSPWLWLDITSFYSSNVSSLDVMFFISLCISKASFLVIRLWVFLMLIAENHCLIGSRKSCKCGIRIPQLRD